MRLNKDEAIVHSSGIANREVLSENSFLEKNHLIKEFYESSYEVKNLMDFLGSVESLLDNLNFVKNYKKQLLDQAQGIGLYSLMSQDFIQKEQRKQYNKEFILHDINVLYPNYENAFFNDDLSEIHAAVNNDIVTTVSASDVKKTTNPSLTQATFSYILLDVYMPTQDKILSLLGKNLNYNALGQSTLGKILDEIASFSTSSINYNLSGYISQTMGTNNFTTALSAANNKLRQEREQASNDLNVITEVQALINQQLTQLQSNTELTAEQIAELSGTLNSYLSSLSASSQDLSNLLSLLNHLTITSAGSTGFQVEGPSNWQQSLITLEGKVINGSNSANSTNVEGGLLSFFTTCMNDQLSYGDLAQGEQLTLQLELAAIQQEWTIVSSSLRILNKIFMSIASQIKR